MAEPKTIIAGASVAGAAAAGVVLLAGLPFIESEPPALEEEKTGFALCLKSDMPFFDGASAKCYSHADLMALSDAPVLNNAGEAVSVSMTHPTDMAAAQSVCRTCGVWLDLKRDDWYALTSSDQRREAYFIRACGALSLMLAARPAEVNHFTDGSFEPGEIADFLRNAPFGVKPMEDGANNRVITLSVDEDDVDKEEAAEALIDKAGRRAPDEEEFISQTDLAGDTQNIWRFRLHDQLVVLQELALADFDADGVAELLVFTRVGSEDGTAVSYMLGLLEKDSPRAALSFTASDYAS